MQNAKPLTRLPRRTALLALATLILLALPLSAVQAQSLDALRASGALGERWDGLVQVRDGAAAGANKIANEVNAKRKKIYQQDAAKNGTTVEAVGQIYAQQIMNKAPKGTWFLQQNGQWIQR